MIRTCSVSRPPGAPWRALCLTVLACSLLGASADARELEIRGRVLTEGGHPLAEAELLLLPHSDVAKLAALQREGRFEPAPAVRARSAADGTFRLLAPEPGFWKLIARHPAHLDAAAYLIPLIDDTELAPVELPARREMAVRVAAADGSPVAGARVLGRGESAEWTARRERGWWPHHRWGTSGPEGIVRLATTAGEQLSVAAVTGEHLGFAELGAGASAATLVLDRPLSTMRLLDTAGRPVAGATAVLTWPFLDLGTSDEKGQLRLPEPAPGLPLGLLRGIVLEELAQTSKLPAAEPLDFEIIDASSREPLPGALVWSDGGHRRADTRGRVRLELPPGRLTELGVAAPGHLVRTIGKVQRPPGSREPIVVALLPALALSGRVLDPAGEPIAGAELKVGLGANVYSSWTWPMQNRATWPGPVTTDAEGRFRISRLAPGIAYRLEVQRNGFAPRQVEVPSLDPATPPAPVEIILDPGIVAFGKVVDELEQPIAGAQIRVSTRPLSTVVDPGHFPFTTVEATTDVDGRFSLRDLSAGLASLFVHAEGFADLTVPGLELSPGKTPADLGVVQLERGVVIEGKVVDGEDRPLAGAEVSLQQPGFASRMRRWRTRGGLPATTTGSDGRFRLEPLSKTALVALHVQHPGFLSRTLEKVHPSIENQLVIVLEPAAVVTALVVDRAGNAVAGAEVTLMQTTSNGSSSQGTRTDDEGRARFEQVPPGEMEISARAEAAAAPRRKLVLAAGGPPVEVRLELLPAATLWGRVVDEEGEPLVGASIEAWPSEVLERTMLQNGRQAYGHSIDDGRFLISGLEAGRWRVTGSFVNLTSVTQEVVLREGEVREIEIVLEGPASKTATRVVGQVLDGAGQPRAGALVQLVAAVDRNEVDRVLSAVDGGFELRASMGSSFEVVAYLPGTGSGRSGPFELAPGEVRNLDLVLGAGGTITGRLLGLELAELGAVRVSAYSNDGRQAEGAVRHDGSYRLESLPAGEWRIIATTPRVQFNLPEPVVLSGDGETVEIDLPLGGTRPLHGRVWVGGKPAASITVSLVCQDGGAMTHTTSRSDGSFWLDVPPAPCQLFTSSPFLDQGIHQVIDGSNLDALGTGPLIATDPQTGTEVRIELDP